MADQAVSQATPTPNEIDEAKIQEYIAVSGLAGELSPEEQRQFVQFCVSYQLDPYRGEVYASVYGSGEYRNLSIIVNYLVYIKRAELSGRLDGWSVDIEGAGEDMEAVLTIYRKDWQFPFHHRVYWNEAAQKKRDGSLTGFWRKMPRFLLKKVAISQGFRLCFASELGGMAYDPSELPEEMTRPVQVQTSSKKDDETKATPPTKERKKADRHTIPFPAAPDSSEDERTRLEGIIREMLKTNGLSFPKAHTDWIERELAKKPSVKRLEQVIEHMQSVVGGGDEGEEKTKARIETQPDGVNELIF